MNSNAHLAGCTHIRSGFYQNVARIEAPVAHSNVKQRQLSSCRSK